MMPLVNNENNRINDLDALRGIAAISVMFFHYTMETSYGNYFFKLLCMGVEMFFIISGYVIFMTIQGTKTWKEFVIKRFIRLYPTYWACVIITFLLIVLLNYKNFAVSEYASIGNSIKQFGANLTMFQYFFEIKHLDGSYWTLTIELQFYLFILLIYVVKNEKVIQILEFSLLFISFLFGFKLFFDINLSQKLLFWFPLFRYYPLFLAGISFYKLKKYGRKNSLYLLIGCCFFVQCFIFKNIHYHDSRFLNLTEYTIILIGIFLIFFFQSNNQTKFIVNPITIELGKISYCLYALHQFIGRFFLIPFFTKLLGLEIAIVISATIVLILAKIIHRHIEIPSIAYFKLILLKKNK